MFWTDWGLKTVQRATLNGQNIKVLINDSLNFVNGLTIDYKNERIYWVDAAFDKIESSTLDGNDRKEVKVNGLKHPFGITIFNENLYWTDWITRSVSIAGIDGGNQRVLKSELPGVMDVCIFDESRQQGTFH
jgi:hypothetical protein